MSPVIVSAQYSIAFDLSLTDIFPIIMVRNLALILFKMLNSQIIWSLGINVCWRDFSFSSTSMTFCSSRLFCFDPSSSLLRDKTSCCSSSSNSLITASVSLMSTWILSLSPYISLKDVTASYDALYCICS